ncbi:MAG: VWA domain-containing protein [Clostridia bacterium]|nr:VWA domain-containing protein [Clostridia bacterium]
MKNNTTELVFILDKSGSMAGLESDVTGGFNSMLGKQKKLEGECFITTVLFSNSTETLHDRLPVDEVKELGAEDYCVGGCTALIDAIGETIRHISDIHKYARSSDVPERTMFVIMTDGMENASRTYSSDKVKKMIEDKKKKDDWEFIFMGANIDAVETAGNLGIAPEGSVDFKNDSTGQRLAYEVMNDAVTSYRSGRKLDQSWKAKLQEDVEKRGR